LSLEEQRLCLVHFNLDLIAVISVVISAYEPAGIFVEVRHFANVEDATGT
jgi:hypothetical protein